MLSFFSLLRLLSTRPSASTTSSPSACCARDAPRHGRGAARIGGEIAADRAGAFGRQQQRIEPVDIRRRFAHAPERHAGFRRDRVRGRVDLADLVHAVERQHDLAVMRNLPADQPGIAALRHDRRLRLVGEFEDRRYLRDRARPQHHRGVAMIEVAHLAQIRLLHGRIGDGVFLADDRGEAGQQIAADLDFVGLQRSRRRYDIHVGLSIVFAALGGVP